MEDTTETTTIAVPEVAPTAPVDGELIVAEMPDRPQRRMNMDEWFEISRSLECYHAVFYKLWDMGRPVFNYNIETAAVQFDPHGNFVYFHFNPDFWDSRDFYNRLFVICHEVLHVILNHGIRTTNGRCAATNVALDVVVNHSLIRDFGFDRDLIFGEDKLCWVDTVFKDKNPLPPDDESYEYYWNLFEKVYISLKGKGGKGKGGKGEKGEGEMPEGLETVDDHSMMGEPNSEKWDEIIKDLNESINDEEKQSLQDLVDKHFQKGDPQLNSPAGTGTGGQWVFANINAVPKKKKWETVIKQWARKYMNPTDKDVEQWARTSRRMATMPSDMFLPSTIEMEDDYQDKTRINVYFFLDTSGSCWGLKDRFFTAAMSLPPERFNIRLLCFDTTVQETTLESKKIYGGGGTSFDILESFVQKEINAGSLYPDGVFVITDGYGNNVAPQMPKKWHWFITEGGTKNYISKDCNFHNLVDFE